MFDIVGAPAKQQTSDYLCLFLVFIRLVELHLWVFFPPFSRVVRHFSSILRPSVIETKLFPWVCDQVWESSALLLRGQPEPEEQQQSFSEGISCGLCTVPFKYRNHRTWREAALFSLDVRVACTEPHITGADRSVSPHLIITVSCPRVYDTLELDDVLSSVCLYAFIIASIWLQIGVSGNRLTWVKHLRCLDHKNISSLWIPFGFKVTENIMFLTELTHIEIIWTSSLWVTTSDFTTDLMFHAEQQRNLLLLPGIMFVRSCTYTKLCKDQQLHFTTLPRYAERLSFDSSLVVLCPVRCARPFTPIVVVPLYSTNITQRATNVTPPCAATRPPKMPLRRQVMNWTPSGPLYTINDFGTLLHTVLMLKLGCKIANTVITCRFLSTQRSHLTHLTN